MLVHQLTKAKQALDAVSQYHGIEFAYAVFKNKQLIDKKLMESDFIKNVTPEVVEYEEKRLKLCETFANKDDNGKPIIIDDLFVIDDKDNFKIEMDRILEQYRPYVEERQKQIELFNLKMNQEVDFEFFKVKKEHIPPQLNTAQELYDIGFMLE